MVGVDSSGETVLRFISVVAIAAIVMLTASPAFAQAFGLTKGMTLDQLDVVQAFSSRGTNYRYAINPPEPNPALENYSAVITPEHGLCYASGATPIAEGRNPEPLRQRLFVALTGIYGESVRAEDMTDVFRDVPRPLLAVGVRVTAKNVVMVEYVFDNFGECQESSRQLDQTGL